MFWYRQVVLALFLIAVAAFPGCSGPYDPVPDDTYPKTNPGDDPIPYDPAPVS